MEGLGFVSPCLPAEGLPQGPQGSGPGQVTAVKRMAIYICMGLPGGLGAQRSLFAFSLPNYISVSDDQIKMRERNLEKGLNDMHVTGTRDCLARTSGWPWVGRVCHQLSSSRLPSNSGPHCLSPTPHLWVPTHPPHFLGSRDSSFKSSSRD